tara:strand:- start:28454 stop:29134 length:681 start_codon:yes stop_codon:yes gene_type:complete
MQHIPVITIDGPGGVGKGTLSKQLATHLGWHFLESGALYRVLAIAAQNHSVANGNVSALAVLARHLDVVFEENPSRILLEGQDISKLIRTEECGSAASKIAQLPDVREALLARQHAFLQAPGLIADGRDMGTVIFPKADLKLFLQADPEVRAKRRQFQLKEQGIDVSLDSLFSEIAERDLRDRERKISPLRPASDAIVINTSDMPIVDVFTLALEEAKERGLVGLA